MLSYPLFLVMNRGRNYNKLSMLPNSMTWSTRNISYNNIIRTRTNWNTIITWVRKNSTQIYNFRGKKAKKMIKKQCSWSQLTIGNNWIEYLNPICILNVNSIGVWTQSRSCYVKRININISTIVEPEVELWAVFDSKPFNGQVCAHEESYGLQKPFQLFIF